MYSPLRASTSFTDTRLRSLLRSQSKDSTPLADSYLRTEELRTGEMTEAFTKSMRAKIRQEVNKSPARKSVKFEENSQENEKQLLKRGEDYAKHVLSQLNRSDTEKQSEAARVQLSVSRALSDLDSIKTEESDRLQSRVNELKKNFHAGVARLERSVLKQVEQMKAEFLEEVRNEEMESYRRIKLATEKLAGTIAPETKKSVMEKVFGNPRPAPKEVEPSRPKDRSLSAKRRRLADYNSPEKKKMSKEAMQRLSESRRKVMQLTSVSAQNTPLYFATPKRTPNPQSEDSEMRLDDFGDYAQSATTKALQFDEEST